MIEVPRIVAHRGSSGRAPENTLHAMRLAIEDDGAGGLELDLQRSEDGTVVVLHDETVDRTTDGTGRADAMPFDALRELDAAARFGDGELAQSGIRIPTLEEVLESFPDTWMSLDLKQGDPVTERATVDLLQRFGRTRDLVVSAENPDAARRLARLAPEIPRFVHRDGARSFYRRHRLRFFAGWRPPGDSLQIPVRHGGRDLSSRRLIADAHARGMRILYWTVNDPDLARVLLERGADGIITDWPGRMRDLASP